MTSFRHLLLLVVSVSLLLACESPDADETTYPDVEPTPYGEAFLNELKSLCGQELSGTTVYPDESEHRLYKAGLRMVVETCEENQVQIPFYINDYPPRIWIISLESDGRLSLRHNHTDESETPENVNMYGGYATQDGSATLQKFTPDIETTAMIPEAASNIWTMSIDRDEGLFIYELNRGNRPRFKGEFILDPEL